MTDRDVVWLRSDKTRWRMSVVPSAEDAPSTMLLTPYGAESEGRSDLEPMTFTLAGSIASLVGA